MLIPFSERVGVMTVMVTALIRYDIEQVCASAVTGMFLASNSLKV